MIRARNNYQFSKNWTARGVRNWEEHLLPLAGTPLTYLEIGVFEGRSGCWMLDRVLTHPNSRYIGIDCWDYAKKYRSSVIEERARSNIGKHSGKGELLRGQSQLILRQSRWLPSSIDIGYIDGDHRAYETLADSVLTWPLIKPNGLLIWDDYRLRVRDSTNPVRIAIDSFLACVAGQYEPVFKNNQVGIRKNVEAT